MSVFMIVRLKWKLKVQGLMLVGVFIGKGGKFVNIAGVY